MPEVSVPNSNLRSNSKYAFRVIALNDHGPSEPSEATNYVTPKGKSYVCLFTPLLIIRLLLRCLIHKFFCRFIGKQTQNKFDPQIVDGTPGFCSLFVDILIHSRLKVVSIRRYTRSITIRNTKCDG